MVRLFAQLVRLLYFWIITSALVLFWVMRLRLEMDQDQDPSLTIVSQVPIQLRSHNTFLISITPQPVLSLLFNREQAFVTFVTPPPLELPQINWYDSINIGKWQLMGTRFWNFCTDKWKCFSFSFHCFNPISDGIKNWAPVIFTKTIVFLFA